jgi:cell division protein FtsZ
MMRSKYTLAAMAILASCYSTPITTYAFVAPAASSSHLLHKSFAIYASNKNNNIEEGNDNEGDDILFTSAVASGWQPDRGTFAGITRRTDTKSSTTALGMSDDAYAVIPDGGLSPCVIKVVGVGGGGCNAVSILLSANFC